MRGKSMMDLGSEGMDGLHQLVGGRQEYAQHQQHDRHDEEEFD